MRDIIMFNDKSDIEAAQAELEETKRLTQEALDAARVNCQTPEELAMLAKIDGAAPNYQEARDRAVALGLQNKHEEAMAVFQEEARPYLLECVSGGQELMKLNVQMGNAVSERLTNQSRVGMLTMSTVTLVAAILAIALGILVSRGISRPVRACAERLVLLSQGDLHTGVAVDCVFHTLVRQSEPALQQIHPQHFFNPHGRTAPLALGIVWRNVARPLFLRNDFIHNIQKFFPLRCPLTKAILHVAKTLLFHPIHPFFCYHYFTIADACWGEVDLISASLILPPPFPGFPQKLVRFGFQPIAALNMSTDTLKVICPTQVESFSSCLLCTTREKEEAPGTGNLCGGLLLND